MSQCEERDGYVICREAEHQELWYPGSDLTAPVGVHIPSALGLLGYYVCVRVPEVWADRLARVEVSAQIGGLRPDDVRLKPGENVACPAQFPSSVPGHVWRVLVRMFVSRGDGAVQFHGWPRELRTTDLLLCTWPRYLASGQADDWLACQADPLWAPTGIPLGGIGVGRLDLCRDGRFRNFSGNNNQDMPFEEPAGLEGAGLVVAVGNEARSLTTRPVGGAPGCGALHFTGRFPQAGLDTVGAIDGIRIGVQASGTLCPHDLRRSSIPGAIIRWHLHNEGREKRAVRCEFRWPNLIGRGGGIAQEETDIGKGDGVYCFWDESSGREETLCETERFVGVRFTRRGPVQRRNSDGEHLLVVGRSQGVSTGADARSGAGRVWGEVEIAPGSRRTVDMALVWAMPHWVDTKRFDRGHLWLEHFPNAEAMAMELIDHTEETLDETGSLARLLDRTSLPDWLKRRLSNCNYPLITNSVLCRDGRFSVNEGPTEMCGCYGTIDQRLGAHPATQLLFPELNRRELSQFAAAQSPNGGINHDLGHGHLESGPRDQPWPDIPCSFIIQSARHAWSTGDSEFSTAVWPKVRKALLRHAEWAEQGHGIAQVGFGLGTSYDGYHYEGSTPYVGTLWLAALAVAEKWARQQGDTDLLPRIEAWRSAALKRMDEDLWNGRFYVTCGQARGARRETSHAGQLAGQFFSRMLAGRDVLPPDRLDPCLDSLMALNGSDRFAAPPDEVAPDGRGTVEFGWLPYVEAFAVPAAALAGDRRAMAVWQRMVACMDQAGERLCDTRLMYRPSTGEPSWGAYYMTAPASWLVYDAFLDFAYWPEEGVLRLNPRVDGTLAVVHPLWWGLAEVSGSEIRLRVERRFVSRPLDVRWVELERPGGSGPCPDRYERVALREPVVLQPGAEVAWSRQARTGTPDAAEARF